MEPDSFMFMMFEPQKKNLQYKKACEIVKVLIPVMNHNKLPGLVKSLRMDFLLMFGFWASFLKISCSCILKISQPCHQECNSTKLTIVMKHHHLPKILNKIRSMLVYVHNIKVTMQLLLGYRLNSIM